MKSGVKFGRNFPCYVFQGFGVRRKISPKFHVKNGAKNGKFHANFTLLVRSADEFLWKESATQSGPFPKQSGIPPAYLLSIDVSRKNLAFPDGLAQKLSQNNMKLAVHFCMDACVLILSGKRPTGNPWKIRLESTRKTKLQPTRKHDPLV